MLHPSSIFGVIPEVMELNLIQCKNIPEPVRPRNVESIQVPPGFHSLHADRSAVAAPEGRPHPVEGRCGL